MNIKENLRKLRVWIDGDKNLEKSDGVFEEVKDRKKSESEDFLQTLSMKIKDVLENEVVRPPNGKTAYVPSLFIVFISEPDEALLPKRKREFFEQTLSALITESAKESARGMELSCKQIQIEIRVDGTLNQGQIDVKAFDEVLQKSSNFRKSLDKTIDWKLIAPFPEPKRLETPVSKTIDEEFSKSKTIDDNTFQFKPFYWLEVWQNGVKQNEFPIVKDEILIGRDDANVKETHIRLQTENLKISSQHTKITRQENGEITVTGLKKMNPTMLANKPLVNGESAVLVNGDTIQIYEFTLQLRFAE
jgi:FHA domain